MDKNHILSEIMRTATANGGVPLGQRRFFQETGIKQTDWVGKFWARWSDAVREAGLEPNKKNSASDANLLIESYLALMRELGRFPVISELQLRKRNDPTFPSHKTFRKFGTKQQLAAKILGYCNGRPDYSDIIAMCNGVAERPESGDDESQQEAFGFVYLLKSARHYKIGHSNSVGRREYELAIQLPEKLTLIHAIRTDDPAGIEAYWHKRFDDKRGNGEWFALTAADVTAFKRRKFM